MANTTLLEKGQILGSTVLLNYLPIALGLALIVYLGAGLSLFLRLPYSVAVRWGMNFAANLTILIATSSALKLLLSGPQSASLLVKCFMGFIIATLTIWFSARGYFLTHHMILSRRLALFVLPVAFIFVGHEIINLPKFPQNSSTISYQSNNSTLPNIILVTMDSCSSRYLSCYGYSRPTTPNLDSFAKNAILFEQFYANTNWTRPGIASLLNAVRPWSHAGDIGRPRGADTERLNLLGCLARAGYDIRTVSQNGFADHDWQGTPVTPDKAVSVEADGSSYAVNKRVIRSYMFSKQLGPAVFLPGLLRLFSKGTKTRSPLSSAQEKSASPLALAKEILSGVPPHRPSFFWIHFISPHDPYATNNPYLGCFETSPLARNPSTSGADYQFSASRHPER